MRRLIRPALAVALIASTFAAPARAEEPGDVADCVKQTYRWCKEARKDANFIEEMAVDFVCTIMLVGCAFTVLDT